ncbi:MAG: hypothetical protein IRZ33_03745 [Alicyclobacillaceae bacterium]|nr:hypothetical protein [Alicyclobacillaceae bacterium]
MDWKPVVQNRWLVALGVVGVACLVFGSMWNGGGRSLPAVASDVAGASGQPVSAGSNPTMAQAVNATMAYEHSLDRQLEGMLEKIVGVHSVSVMVTLDSSDALTVANNVRKTTQSQVNGSQRTESTTVDTQVFTQNAGGNETPFVIQSQTPTVRGVLVTVNADDFYVAKAEIIDAIANVLDVPAYKISVEPQKGDS